MRKRNIKLNVFLNEEEQKQLKEISKKYKISQSKLIRDIITNYTEKNISNKDIDTIINTISNTIKELTKLKKVWKDYITPK